MPAGCSTPRIFLVSPVRYEAYGLAVHEALSRGVPALVSRTAGIAERFPPGFDHLLLDAGVDAGALATRLLEWRGNLIAWRQGVECLGRELRVRTMDDMCRDIARIGDACAAGSRSGVDA